MQCAACGKENRPGARFCYGCGAVLSQSCPKCGAELRAAARFCDSCGAPVGAVTQQPSPPSPPQPTSFCDGRYEVRRFLGEGGKKRVYLAHDAKLDRDVAFALIKTDGLDQEGLLRIKREAQAMGRLGDHPHIVSVHDIGEIDDPLLPGGGGLGRRGGAPYLVSQPM